MKKLLSLMGVFTIGTSLSATVVSCNARIEDSSVQYNKTLIKSILAKILGTEYDDAWFDFGDMASSGVESQLVSMINETSSLQYAYESTNSINKELQLATYNSVGDYNSQVWQNKLNDVLEDKLFTEYTTSITSNDRLDYSKIANLYTLNMHTKEAVNDINGDPISNLDFDNNNYYSIYYIPFTSDNATVDDTTPLKKWSFYHENGDSANTATTLPTLQDLTEEFSKTGTAGTDKTARFYLVSNTLKNNDKVTVADAAGKISSKTAVRLRFQDYFNNSIKSSAWENALTLAYGSSTMYNIRKLENNYQAFINSASPLFNMAQSWKTSKTNKLTTNVKLVWTIKYKASDDDTVEKILQQQVSKKAIDSNGTLSSATKIKDIIDAINTGYTPSTNSLSDDPATPTYPTKVTIDPDSLSYDPYLGLQGYKGMTIYNGTTSVGTSPIANEKYETNVENYNYRGGIVRSNPYYWYTPNSTDNNYHEIVLALPIYTIQLLQGYQLVGSDDNAINLHLGPTASNAEGYDEVWNYAINTDLHSQDVTNMASNTQIRDALLNDIQYLICQDSSITSLAKSVIYSKYIDPEDIYYAGLYSDIGKYIKSGEDD